VPPETRYAESDAGLIAYQVFGEGPFDLVYMSGSVSNVDMRWEVPPFASFFERLASFSRLILFDRRGTGASDRVPVDAVPTWEEWGDDLRVVLDAAKSDHAAILAILDGGPMAMVFAATHPDRTKALVLANTTARVRVAEDYPAGLPTEAAEATLKLFEDGWGTEEFAAALAPTLSSDRRMRAWFAKYQRASASPRMAAAQFRSILDLDVRSVLESIRVPTLVLHRTTFAFIPLEHGKYLAEHIPGARLVEVPGSDSSFTFEQPDLVLDTVEEFLTGVRRVPPADRVLATVLFTDLVDSTQRASEMGDRQWRALLDRHDELAKTEVERHRGRALKSTGDGILATFDSPGRAIRCTLSIRDQVQNIGLPMRAGLHAGEVELRDDDVGGIAVHIAARVSAQAGPGEVLVSRTVSDLVAGSGITFQDRGSHSLKGVPGEWQLFAVEG
jgi:class 3 adenylate cyclase/pimeloyl-ACP methyl ester carboxylesterase